MHGIEEVQLVDVEFCSRLRDLVKVELIDHVLHSEYLLFQEASRTFLKSGGIFSVRRVPSK